MISESEIKAMQGKVVVMETIRKGRKKKRAREREREKKRRMGARRKNRKFCGKPKYIRSSGCHNIQVG